MPYPVLAIGADRLTRQNITSLERVGPVARLAFWGATPGVRISEYDVTGSRDALGSAPLIGVIPDKYGDVTGVHISGTGGGRRIYAPSQLLVTGGIVTIDPRLYLSDIDGHQLTDISHLVQSGRVTVDPSSDPIWQFEAEVLIDDDLPRKYQDWILATLDFTSPDPSGKGNRREHYALGLYKVRPYSLREEQWGGTALLKGNDALWTLRADINGSAYSVAAGTNYTTAVTTLLAARGFTRTGIQPTTATLPKKKTWRSGTPWLQIANDLLKQNGYVPLWPDGTGVLRSHAYQKIGDQDPAAVYTAADVVDAVSMDPDEERFANHVVVLGNSPSNATFRATRTNNDADSLASTVTLGFTKGIFEQNGDLATQDAVDKRADYLMERANTMQVRAEVTTMRLHQFKMYEAIKFDLVNNAGRQVLDGKWRMERFVIDLSENAQPSWTLGKLERFTEVI